MKQDRKTGIDLSECIEGKYYLINGIRKVRFSYIRKGLFYGKSYCFIESKIGNESNFKSHYYSEDGIAYGDSANIKTIESYKRTKDEMYWFCLTYSDAEQFLHLFVEDVFKDIKNGKNLKDLKKSLTEDLNKSYERRTNDD